MSPRRPLFAAILFALSLSLSACAGAYEEAREFAAISGVVVEKSAPGGGAKKAAKKKGAKKKGAEKKAAAAKDKNEPPAVGACVTYQFMGGADCEEAITKRNCYDKRLNVVDWRNGLSCAAAFLSPPEKKP
ncbi:hypothetical protein IY145_05420 [Methylosinus sp. H3A]|uniref:hypothetical protein n=1 Tax=Methylosinus sp. H3A TaxID=2785786 RepID=UPI0018C1D087|nr:hypothetical protein [Methylosinus sp. H3A]MBG0808808.1 hypothetical protein [Methylosinus sp. H3A]